MRFAAEKWADYCIIAVDYDENGLIKTAHLFRDEGDRVEDRQSWNRAELIDAMLKGTTFVTAKDSSSGWGRVSEVSLIKVGSDYFLRVDDRSIAEDMLGELPQLDE